MTHPFNTAPPRTDVPSADLGDWYNARRPETLRPSDGPSRSKRRWVSTAAAVLATLAGAEIAGLLHLVQVADQRLAVVAAAVAMVLIPTGALLAGSRLINDASWGFSLDRTRVVDVVAGALLTGVIVAIAGDVLAVYPVAMVLAPVAFVATLGRLRQLAGTGQTSAEHSGGDQ